MEKNLFLNKIGQKLNDTANTCMIYRDDELVFTSVERGVAPLVKFIEGHFPPGRYLLADKVIGKAAALLCIKAGIKEVYANTVSIGAESIFHGCNITLVFLEKVPAIRNRSGTGPCPMEELSKGTDDPDEMYSRVIGWLRHK